MEKPTVFGAILVLLLAIDAAAAKPIYSSSLIHRFSEEAKSLWGSKSTNDVSDKTASWPEKKSFGHMRVLLGSDFTRQKLRFGAQNQTFVASQGGQTFNYGNDMGWLHYTWIDIGTPNNSFLVALDTGSDLFWVPCDCIECAPLSLSYYSQLGISNDRIKALVLYVGMEIGTKSGARKLEKKKDIVINLVGAPLYLGHSIMQEKELGEYSPSHSNSSKLITCGHQLCEMGPHCKNPSAHCPYSANYLSEDTSSSGFLFEDQLHLSSVGGNKQQSSAILIGCGSKQSGEYLNGIAPDGLMGLGPGDISVPSLLSKSGLIPHSFSFCYDKSYSGRLYFGDKGPTSQSSTPLLPFKGNRVAYIVEVEGYSVGGSSLKQTGYKAQVDTGSSFTYLPSESYEHVVSEFHRQANATRITIQEFENCYTARSLNVQNMPSLKLVFSTNQSFIIENPMFHIADDQGGVYCLGIQSIDGDIGIIGQNFLMGYRLVFDWEKMKLGWSTSNCEDIDNGDNIHTVPGPSEGESPNPLPTNEQQQNPHVAPAVAGRAPPERSSASPILVLYHSRFTILSYLPLLLWTARIVYM